MSDLRRLQETQKKQNAIRSGGRSKHGGAAGGNSLQFPIIDTVDVLRLHQLRMQIEKLRGQGVIG